MVVNSTSLTCAKIENPTAGMDILLRDLFDQEHKMCDKDEGGCGYSNVSGTFQLQLQGPWVHHLLLPQHKPAKENDTGFGRSAGPATFLWGCVLAWMPAGWGLGAGGEGGLQDASLLQAVS